MDKVNNLHRAMFCLVVAVICINIPTFVPATEVLTQSGFYGTQIAVLGFIYFALLWLKKGD